MVLTSAVIVRQLNHKQKQTENRIKVIQESGKTLQKLLIEEKNSQSTTNVELQKQIEQLKKDLQAKAAAKRSAVANFIAPKAQASGTPDDKLWIYQHESGNNPARYNSIGCLGLGQACPASKLLAVCPNINDYACQDAWFTNYMLKRYGSWANAKAFWLNNHWW